jgi:cysteinyl-tRNA synthetase
MKNAAGDTQLGSDQLDAALRAVPKIRASYANANKQVLETEKQRLLGKGVRVEVREFGAIWIGPADPDKRDQQSIEIDRLIGARNAARAAKKFAEADRIRDELAAMGVMLHDTKDGTTWEIAR